MQKNFHLTNIRQFRTNFALINLKIELKVQFLNFKGLELDSGSSVGGSLPSPGTASCSLDGTSSGTSPSCALAEHAHSPVVSPTTVAAQTGGSVGEPPLSQRVGVLQQRVSDPNWSRQKHISSR